MRHARLFISTLLIVALAPAIAANGTTEPPSYGRAYLLADGGRYLWWSFDRNEPRADLDRVVRTCPTTPESTAGGPCRTPLINGVRYQAVAFEAWSLVDQPLSWSPSAPLRFRFSLEVDSLHAFTVHLINWGKFTVSPPATEVQPGVWEGTFPESATMSPLWAHPFGIAIGFPDAAGSQVPRVTLDLLTDGSSYLDFPDPVPGRPLSWILAGDPASPDPNTWGTDTKTFQFSDRQWSASSFQGDLSVPRDFIVTTTKPATAVIAWVELYPSPFVHHAAKDQQVDPERYTESATVALFRNDVELGHGAGEGGGTESVSAVNVQPGTLTLSVSPPPNAVDPNLAYDAHILVIEGTRTLRSYRSAFNTWADSARAPQFARCQAASESVPMPPKARAFSADLDWDSVTPTKWIPMFSSSFSTSNCVSPWGTGDKVTVVLPERSDEAFQRFWMGAHPAMDSGPMYSFLDTVFQLQVTYHYEPPAGAQG